MESKPSKNSHNYAQHLQQAELYDRLEELLTVSEAAAILKVPKSWVYERTRKRGSDKLPFIKLGKYVRFEPSEVKKFLGNQRKSALGL